MKTYKVKIWDKDLICPICSQNLFYRTRIKIVDSDMPNIDQIRYMFECENCGYDMMYGAVTQWEPEEKLNIKLEEVVGGDIS